MGLLHSGVSMMNSFAARNDTKSKNYRVFSPRFMPLMPDKGETPEENSFLSPTIFALYENSGKEEKGVHTGADTKAKEKNQILAIPKVQIFFTSKT